MAGWFEAFSDFTRGAAPALDRYQALRQLDDNNQFRNRRQQMLDAQAVQESDRQDRLLQRQLENLDTAILKQKQDIFKSNHMAGQTLDPEDLQRAKDASLGGLVQHYDPQSTFTPAHTGVLPNPGETTEISPYDRLEQNPEMDVYTGTPQEAQAAQQRKLMLGVLGKVDVNNPNSIIQANMLAGHPGDIRQSAFPEPKDPNPSNPWANQGLEAAVATWTRDHGRPPNYQEMITIGHDVDPLKSMGAGGQGGGNGYDIPAVVAQLTWAKQTGSIPSLGMGGPSVRNPMWVGMNFVNENGRVPTVAEMGYMMAHEGMPPPTTQVGGVNMQGLNVGASAPQGQPSMQSNVQFGSPQSQSQPQGGLNFNAAIPQQGAQQSPLPLSPQTYSQPSPVFNPAVKQAEVKADTKSLANVQGIYDVVEPFHRAVEANGQVMIAAFNRLKDYGSQFGNDLMRDIGKKVNDPDGNIAAAAAAIFPVVREYARLTTNPNLKGVVTDSAVSDAKNMLPDSMTVAQFLKIWPIMQADMNNVDKSFGQQLQTIRGRLQGGQSNPQQQQPQAADTGGHPDGTKGTINGREVVWTYVPGWGWGWK